MPTSPVPSVARGDITLQPSYFTSSLFVTPLREDIAQLVQIFAQAYFQPSLQNGVQGEEDTVMLPDEASASTYLNASQQPFAYFKRLWTNYGWSWLHFKVFDGRARESFVRVVFRCFSEYFVESVNPLAQTVALFGLYTFFMSQPSASGPSLHSVGNVPLPLDMYKTLLQLPENLSAPHLLPLQSYVIHLLRNLLESQAFHILPASSLRAQNPSDLPREEFVPDAVDAPPEGATAKKKGRPSKRDKARKAKDAVAALDKWLEKNTYAYSDSTDEQGGGSGTAAITKTTHTLISHPPAASRAIYAMEKAHLLNIIETLSGNPQMVPGNVSAGLTSDGSRTPVLAVNPIDPSRTHLITDSQGPLERDALVRANEAVLARLKKIDEMAAERGLEVGGEGGEQTGLARVERAVREFREGRTNSRGGILNLLEGAGVDGADTKDDEEETVS